MNSYYQGQNVTVQATFKDQTGTVVDPATVVFQYYVEPASSPFSQPTPLKSTFAASNQPFIITRVSQGVYVAQIDTTPAAGTYYWEPIAPGQTSTRSSFLVLAL